ncbi:hypothetical protein HZA97_04210 [Candidatus Woesearchaeota archaeon]|nr:hypothetical protein [Candidatus Woesearchaeota archaeon]
MSLKKLIKNSIPAVIIDPAVKLIQEINWRILRRSHPPPPHFIKQRIIRKYAKRFSLKNFVETGTYLGSTVMSVKNLFDKIHSIELDKSLFEQARNKFSSYSHIHIIQGDSSKVLPTILSEIERPALFWLDGHYSEGITAKGDLNTPILKELELILNHKIKDHVILIDDARCFIGKNDYTTIKELKSFVKKINSQLIFEINENIIRITQKDFKTKYV